MTTVNKKNHLFFFSETLIVKKIQRGRAGIEPATSRTRSENHTTRPTALAVSVPPTTFKPLFAVGICVELLQRLYTEPPWPNEQGAPLLRVRLWVRVPLGVIAFFWFHSIKKNNTPCGTQTHNLQIRSLTRYSVAPTGRAFDGQRTNRSL